jgi:transposase
MRQLIERCCGLDVHKKTLTACARVPDREGKVVEVLRTFGATTPDLLSLREWLLDLGVTHVAMESTGVYWKSPYYILEADFEVLLVNATHLKHVPGRKTDTLDAAWIAELLSYGLLKASFVPPQPIRELRDLTRYRSALIRERVREVQRIQKVLEDAGVKLDSVATDVMGASGRAMMRALISGQADPAALSALARGKLRAKLPQLRKALTARFREHHAFLLDRMLAHVEQLEADVDEVSARIEAAIAPFAAKVELLDTIPGVGVRSAQIILAEMGPDMAQFPSRPQLASWAGVCPGQRESAGKSKSAKTRKGSRALRDALIESARAAARTRDTYLAERYRQVARRRGDKKAIVAVAHEILDAVWYLLSHDQPYLDPGPTFLRERVEEDTRRRAIRQLERLGHEVTLRTPEAA